MRVCQECFKDEELRKEVQNESSGVGVCDVCGTRGPVVDLDHFAVFFRGVLELFSKAPDGQSTVLEIVPSFIDDDIDHWHNKVVKFEVLKEIRKDLSKPLTRYDTELEYVPTQWICEYCKKIGADGISFASSLDKNGINYVLFNQDDAKCKRVKSRTIEEITIKAKK